MNLEALKAGVTSKFARQMLVTQKHSPKILFVAGAVGVVTATVLACRATLKLEAILQTAGEMQDELNEKLDNESVTPEDHQKKHFAIQIATAATIAKNYALPVSIGLVSIGALTGSHVILSKRNGAVMAAYAGLDRAYKQYRQNVVEKYGQDEDRKFTLGAKNVHVEEQTANGKTKVTVKSVADKTGKRQASPYVVLFDEKSTWFSEEPGMNPNTVLMKQSWANDKLKSNGHLFLNEVYDFLDVPRTKAGAVVGWVYDPKNPDHKGDNYVSFGVFENDEETSEMFIEGRERAIWLDFNVDGVIYNLI